MSDSTSNARKPLPLYATPNLLDKRTAECAPWDFNPGPEALARIKAMPKEERRNWLQHKTTVWNCYSGLKALAPSLRISKDNPPVAVHCLVVDYDAKTDLNEVLRLLNELPEALQPQRLEQTLGSKWRIVWELEKPLFCISLEHCQEILKAFGKKIGAETLLPGFDSASYRPTELWSNGGVWYDLKQTPVAWDLCFGVACDVASRSNLFGAAEIPLEVIHTEVKKRFPDRWTGDFVEGSTGVRFWDPAADCPTGAQVKPTGMLCFTGNQPFVRWSDIFGAHWCAEQRALNLGKAADSLLFDGRNYWEPLGSKWVTLGRGDAILALKNRGLSDKVPKGMTVSDVERVLRHVQMENRVDGAAPMVNYRPGLVDIRGRKVLNTVRLEQIVYPTDATGDPSQFPTIWAVLNEFFPHRDKSRPHPVHFFLAWLQRSYKSIRYYERALGQAVFFCGPPNNGKTLIAIRIIAALLGNRYSNPTDYFMGTTTFSDDLFEAAVLMCNDESPARNEGERIKYGHRIKSFVVNPTHTYHPKFMTRVEIEWCGRFVATCNDDPISVGMLPEVNENTQDKMMFFASQSRSTPWPGNIAEIFQRELPYYAYWLDFTYAPPAEVLADDRMGVQPYYDPHILELSQTQLYSYNLIELVKQWIKVCWNQDQAEWVGSPTDLLAQIAAHDFLSPLLKEWTVAKISKSLTAAARLKDGAVTFAGEGQRIFKIEKAKIKLHV